MAVPKTPGEAIAKRLLSDDAIVALVGNRVTPNVPETDPEADYVVFQRATGGAGFTLQGRSGLQQYFYRLDVFARNDETAEIILAACQRRLFGDRRAGVAGWVAREDGVQGCFPVDDMTADTLEDGSQANGQTFSLWFCPQV